MQHVWERTEMYIKFRYKNLVAKDHLEDLGTDGRITKMNVTQKDLGEGGGHG
jgi:hypothetical protein